MRAMAREVIGMGHRRLALISADPEVNDRASARIEDNVIDGVDKAGGRVAGGGRGVGIGLTWNATASIRREGGKNVTGLGAAT